VLGKATLGSPCAYVLQVADVRLCQGNITDSNSRRCPSSSVLTTLGSSLILARLVACVRVGGVARFDCYLSTFSLVGTFWHVYVINSFAMVRNNFGNNSIHATNNVVLVRSPIMLIQCQHDTLTF